MRMIGAAVMIVIAALVTADPVQAGRYTEDNDERVCYAYETQWVPDTRVVYVRGNAEGMELAKTLYENSLDHIEVSTGEPTNEYGNKVFLSGTGGKDFVLFSSELRRELREKQAGRQRITLDDDACREQRSTMKRIAGPIKKVRQEVEVRVPCGEKVAEYDEYPEVVTPQRTYYGRSCPEIPAFYALFFSEVVSSPCYSSSMFHRHYRSYYRYNDRYDRYHPQFRVYHPYDHYHRSPHGIHEKKYHSRSYRNSSREYRNREHRY